MAKTYWEKLKDPRWQRRRLEILDRDNFTCQLCGSKDETLHVHHRIYRKGAQPWEYADDDLVTLCEKCHGMETTIREALNESIATLEVRHLIEVVGFAQGLRAKDLVFSGEGDAIKWRMRGDSHARGFILGCSGMVPVETVRKFGSATLIADDIEALHNP